MDPPTIEEIKLLEELRDRLSDLDLTKEELANKNLVRYLRARNNDLDAAELMFRNGKERYIRDDVKSLLMDFETPKNWEKEFEYNIIGQDRNGNAFYVVKFGPWDIQKEMAAGNKEEFIRYICHNIEKLWNHLKWLSKDAETMKQGVGIVDLEGLSFRQCSSIDVMEVTLRCLKTFESNYPETLKSAVILNAPWVFSMVWKLMKPFMSEKTQAKVVFAGSDREKWKEAISTFADPHQYPVEYGGTLPDTTKLYIALDGSATVSENHNENEKALSIKY